MDLFTSAKQNSEEMDKRSFNSRHSSRTKISSFSKSSSQARVKEQLKVVELRARAATLERKQKLKSEAETLRLEEKIAIAEGREEMPLKKSFYVIRPEYPFYVIRPEYSFYVIRPVYSFYVIRPEYSFHVIRTNDAMVLRQSIVIGLLQKKKSSKYR
jgi:hypothetical protein